MKSEDHPAPEHLSAVMANWWRCVLDEYELDDHHVHLLRLACEAWDRAQQARATTAADGLTVTDRFGQAKAHPMAQVQKEAEANFARLLRQLDLDGEPDPSQRRRMPDAA